MVKRYVNRWKTVPGFNNRYLASPMGAVMDRKTGLLANINEDDSRYFNVQMNNKSYKLHRIIALAFVHNIDPKKYLFVDHINCNRKDDRACNLRWVTAKQNNMRDSHLKHISESFNKHKNMPVLLFKDTKIKWFPSIANASRFIHYQKPNSSRRSVETHLSRIASNKQNSKYIYGFGCMWCPYGKTAHKNVIKYKHMIPVNGTNRNKEIQDNITINTYGIGLKKVILNYKGSEIKFKNRYEAAEFASTKLPENIKFSNIVDGLNSVYEGNRYSYRGFTGRYADESKENHITKILNHSNSTYSYKSRLLYVTGHGRFGKFETLLEAANWIRNNSEKSRGIYEIKYYLGKTIHYHHDTQRNRTAYGYSAKWFPKVMSKDDKLKANRWIASNINSDPYSHMNNKNVLLSDGKKQMKFKSARQAGKYIKKITNSKSKASTISNMISRVCRGHGKTAYGFSAKYVK